MPDSGQPTSVALPHECPIPIVADVDRVRSRGARATLPTIPENARDHGLRGRFLAAQCRHWSPDTIQSHEERSSDCGEQHNARVGGMHVRQCYKLYNANLCSGYSSRHASTRGACRPEHPATGKTDRSFVSVVSFVSIRGFSSFPPCFQARLHRSRAVRGYPPFMRYP